MLTVTVNSTRLNDQLTGLREAFIGRGQMGDAATVVEDETRRLNKQIIKLIPPPGLDTAALQKGELAVKKDLTKLFTPVNEDFLNQVVSEFGVSGIDAWFTSPSTKNHYELKFDKIDQSGSGMSSFHRSRQDRRGRVKSIKQKRVGNKWRAAYVAPFQNFNAYLKKIQSHVGWSKAAFGKFYKSLGGRLPKWIDRHVTASASEIHNDVDNHVSPSITMIARAPGLLNYKRIVSDAVRIRAEAISLRIKLIRSDYSKQVKQGMIIRRKEHRKHSEDLDE